MPPDPVVLIAPYLSSASIGPRAVRCRKLVAGWGSAGREVAAVAVGDGRSDEFAAATSVLAAAPGPLVGGMGEPGLGRRRRLRSALVAAGRRFAPLPDAHVRWALALARDPALAEPPAGAGAIYAVAAPFSSLVLGAVLGRRWGLPVIGDLGDPWPLRNPAERRLARWTLSRLDALVVTNSSTADAYRAELRPGVPLIVAPNGAEEVRRIDPAAAGPGPPLFLQLGTLSDVRVDPGPAFAALVRLEGEGAIRFRSHGEAWVRLAPEVAGHHRGVIDEGDARELMRTASAIVVIGNRDAIQVPSKVYEIARSDLWALYVSELDREPGAEVLRASGHAVLAANSEAEVRAAALEILAREERAERPAPSAEHDWETTLERVLDLPDRVGRASATHAAAGEVQPR